MWQLLIPIIGGLIVKGIIDESKDGEKIPARRIFISHSWRKSGQEYQKFIKKLKIADVGFYDHSIPEKKAFDENRKGELKKIFRKQMIYCSKVFVLAKNGIKPNSYVGIEIEIAKELGKEIIAIRPHGQRGIPPFIRKNANIIISNNTTSIKNTLKSKK